MLSSVLEELAMGAPVSVLDTLASSLCGELAVLVSVLVLAVKLSNSSCADVATVWMFSESGGEVLYTVSSGIHDSLNTRTLWEFRV